MRNFCGYDSYWKLKKYHRNDSHARLRLETAGYLNVDKLGRGSFNRQVQRLDLGLPCYDQIIGSELEHFIVTRRIKVAEFPKNRRAAKIKALEAADLNPSFEQFLELSPEIRCQIYRHYFSEFPENLRCPNQPPLTKVSRLLRKEALPLFYQSITVEVGFHPHRSRPGMKIRIDQDTYCFLMARLMSPENLAEINALLLRVDFEKVVSHGSITCKVDLNSGLPPTTTIDRAGVSPAGRIIIESKLQQVFCEISSRPGKKRLKLDDVFAARRVIEDVCFPK